jgi:hypothetical protein
VVGKNIIPNKSVETNRRHASPLIVGRQFAPVLHVPPSLSAAVAHLWRFGIYAHSLVHHPSCLRFACHILQSPAVHEGIRISDASRPGQRDCRH